MIRLFLARRSADRLAPTVAERAESARIRAIKSRVSRPGLVALLEGKGNARSEFDSSPIVPSAVINNPAALLLTGPNHPADGAPIGERWVDVLCEIPADSLTAANLGTIKGGESVRLWIKQHCATLVDADNIAILRFDPEQIG